ncbi:MAG: hypothetical protein ABI977_07850 [Acidobacteriota bacterium]
MSFEGLPDFQQPIEADGVCLFYPYTPGDAFTLSPQWLEVATRQDGRPDFALELVRGKNAYGVLDFTLRPQFRLEQALLLARQQRADARIELATFTAGFFRWQAQLQSPLPGDWSLALPLGWNGLGNRRFVLKLSPDAALLLREALSKEALTLSAVAEVELAGIAPRLPVRVKFSPAALLRALAELGNAERQVAQADAVNFLQRSLERLPLQLSAGLADHQRGDFAAVLTDHIRARFGSFTPSPVEPITPHFKLATPEAAGDGSFEWDLSQPFIARRSFTLPLHVLDEARTLVRRAGVAAVCRETTAPVLPTGQHAVSVSFNFAAAEWPNLAALGAVLRVPPKPPQRMQTATAAVEVRPPQDAAVAQLRLAPLEKLAYEYTSWAAITHSRGVERWEKAAAPHAGELLHLGPAEFPFASVLINADQGLLAQAKLAGVCQWSMHGARAEVRFSLDAQHPAVGLALPALGAEATLELTACAFDGNGALPLAPQAARSLQLGLCSFPAYGPHRITVTADFTGQSNALMVELLPEDRPEAERSLVPLTPSQPQREWRWFAAALFQSGYRFRLRARAGAASAPWSDVRPYDAALTINAQTGEAL